MRSGQWLIPGGSLMAAVLAASLLIKGLFNAPVVAVVYVVIVVAFAGWHGAVRYGLGRILGFGLAATAISGGYETLSLLTGFPFGHYAYTDRIGPRIGLVPVVVPVVYFAMGYVSWTVAQSLLSLRDPVVSGGRMILLPVAAALVMVIWHLPIDPVQATVRGYWTWRDGGAFFGVPLQNFFGWFLCAWTFFMVFALMNRRPPPGEVPAVVGGRAYWLLPVLIYAAFILDHLGGAVRPEDRPVTVADGHVWWTGDLFGAMALISLLTALPIVLQATVRIFRDFPPSQASGR